MRYSDISLVGKSPNTTFSMWLTKVKAQLPADCQPERLTKQGRRTLLAWWNWGFTPDETAATLQQRMRDQNATTVQMVQNRSHHSLQQSETA